MTELLKIDEPERLTKEQTVEFGALWGLPPLLSTENEEDYEEMWRHIIGCFRPKDFMEVILIRQVLDETWKLNRYTRHQSLGIERHSRQGREFQSERMEALKAKRQAAAEELANKMDRPATDFARLIELHDVVESSVSDVDNLLKLVANEQAHNRALEAGIVFVEQLDHLINSATSRRNDALKQLDLWREGMGQYWRRVSDDMLMEGIFSENAKRAGAAAAAALIESEMILARGRLPGGSATPSGNSKSSGQSA